MIYCTQIRLVYSPVTIIVYYITHESGYVNLILFTVTGYHCLHSRIYNINTLTPKSKSGLNSQMPLYIDTWPLEGCSVICHRTELWDYTGVWCQRKKEKKLTSKLYTRQI